MQVSNSGPKTRIAAPSHMKPLRSIIGLVAVFSGLGAGFLVAEPITWAEIGDAGQTTATGQVTTGIGPLDAITGAIPEPRGADLFKIHISGNFSAETDATFDSMLFLFDSTGKTLLFNDDISRSNINSLISGNFGAGDYWLGISHNPNGFTADLSVPSNVNEPGFWTEGVDNSVGGKAYTIRLTGATFAGEPVLDAGTTSSLLGMALFGLAAVRRRLGC